MLIPNFKDLYLISKAQKIELLVYTNPKIIKVGQSVHKILPNSASTIPGFPFITGISPYKSTPDLHLDPRFAPYI